MFNLQNNLANVNFNTIAPWQEVTTLCEKQVSMNFYIKGWSQDNLGSRNRLFKEALYTHYAMDSFPFIALEALNYQTTSGHYQFWRQGLKKL